MKNSGYNCYFPTNEKIMKTQRDTFYSIDLETLIQRSNKRKILDREGIGLQYETNSVIKAMQKILKNILRMNNKERQNLKHK